MARKSLTDRIVDNYNSFRKSLIRNIAICVVIFIVGNIISVYLFKEFTEPETVGLIILPAVFTVLSLAASLTWKAQFIFVFSAILSILTGGIILWVQNVTV